MLLQKSVTTHSFAKQSARRFLNVFSSVSVQKMVTLSIYGTQFEYYIINLYAKTDNNTIIIQHDDLTR